jgi:hypothetical protein
MPRMYPSAAHPPKMKSKNTPEPMHSSTNHWQAKDWVIWSEEHAAWWAKGRLGYTKSLAGAGRYSQAEAQAIEQKANAYCQPGSWNECAFPDPLTSTAHGSHPVRGHPGPNP